MCSDSYGDGWHGGKVIIQGEHYCDSFDQGPEMLVQVNIKGDWGMPVSGQSAIMPVSDNPGNNYSVNTL